jgi:hypothetical protein
MPPTTPRLPLSSYIAQSSPNGIQIAFNRLSRNFSSNTWLNSSNRYRSSTIQNIDADFSPNNINNSINNSTINSSLSEYIAASAPLHCLDGWSFLGRALECHTRGDFDSSRHLAYYAELRGAMSLLASEGIGIFQNKHFFVDVNGTCNYIPINQGTHQIAWDALEEWSILRSGNFTSDVIQVQGYSLGNWLNTVSAGNPLQSIASDWFTRWGLDLQTLKNDRTARNEASYRPRRIDNPTPLQVLNCLRFVHDLWQSHQPTEGNFENIDRHLLRVSLEKTYYGVYGNSLSTSLESRIDIVLRTINFNTPKAVIWKKFLLRQDDPHDSNLIIQANGSSSISDPDHHIQVISRAALLLRFSTAASARLCRNAGITSDDLSFWWHILGSDRSLWEPNNAPDSSQDIWEDINNALETISDWESENQTSNPSYAQWRRECNSSIDILGSCELIGLWGMGC